MKQTIELLILVLSVGIMASCMDNGIDEPPRTEADELAELKVYLDTLENRGLDIDTTAFGVYYVVDTEGTGPFPVNGDTCIVKYDGFFMSGYLFDSSSINNPTDSTYQFNLNVPPMIEGWDDGMKVINEGALVFLIIPSEFAYGSAGRYPAIGPYETLIFRIEMIDIKQAY